MPSEIDQLRQQLKEEQRRREVAEERAISEQRRREEEQHRREEEQRRREEEQRRREEEQQYYEQRTGKTDLAEFLDACHVYLYQDLAVQDATQSTKGTPANADRKLRPARLVPWTDFGAQQTGVWNVVMQSDFLSEKHFTSRHTLEEDGEQLHQRQLSSELDLHYFVRFAINDRITSIIERLSQHAAQCQSLNLRGTVRFENHGNMLTPDEVAVDLQNLAVAPAQRRRRSPRLQDSSLPDPSTTESSLPDQLPTPLPRADQFCVYSVANEAVNGTQRIPVLIMEYKAAHKLTLAHLYAGLREMDVDDIVQEQLNEDVQRRCQRLVAAVLTQAFAYMIASRLEFGCVFTGEAFIFLRIPEEDCSRLHYALAVPQGDVGRTTGWTEGLDQDNRLHLTAVSQLLAFTLSAIRSPRRSLQWQKEAQARLETWQLVLEDLEEEVPKEEMPGSEYRPPQGAAAQFLLQSPISRRLRNRRPAIRGTEGPEQSRSARSDQDSSDDDGAPSTDTPSRAPREPRRGRSDSGRERGQAAVRGGPSAPSHRPGRQRDLGPYCSAMCLKGLVEHGGLDPSCPNVTHHGPGPHHELGLRGFRSSIRRVLWEDLDYCDELGFFGARGCLYRIRVPEWGYTVVAKGTRREFAADLQREARIYHQLRPIQGTWTPVYLGMIHLAQPLHYWGVVPIVQLMVLSFGGYSLNHLRGLPDATSMAIEGLRAIHGRGVLHGDIARRNLLWDPTTQRMTWHDFGRSKVNRRSPLAEKSINHVTIPDAGKRLRRDPQREFSREVLKALAELKTNPPS